MTRPQWEYLTTFLKAEAERERVFLEENWTWKDGIPNYTPESMMPQLDALGEQGWELVHMQPILVGNNADVMLHSDGTRHWSHSYFCVFKRQKAV